MKHACVWIGLALQEKDPVRRPLLSRNHFYLTDVRLALAQRYGQDSPEALRQLTDGELAHKRQLCRQLLQLAERLVPAEHRMRGLLWFELHAAEAESSRRHGLDQGPDAEALRASLLVSGPGRTGTHERCVQHGRTYAGLASKGVSAV